MASRVADLWPYFTRFHAWDDPAGAFQGLHSLLYGVAMRNESLLQLAWVFTRFVLGWLYTLLWCILCMAVSLVGLPRLAWLITCRPWSRGSLRILGVDIKVVGRENLVGPALFVSNHQSLIDVVFLPGILPRRVRWIAKQQLARVPLWGWAFGTSGAIFIDRSNPRRAIRSIRDGLEKLPADWSVVIFPEGTRTRDGHLRPFKKGAFHMARQSRMRVVPIGMYGARHIVPKDGWLVRPGVVEVTVGQPIETDHWQGAEIDQRMDEMRQAVADCVEASRQRYLAAFPDAEDVEAAREAPLVIART